MDIEKEREAFEDKLKRMGKVDDSNFSVADDGSYEWDTIHFAWTIWQAAKAQAVQEGFVLVPKELSIDAIKNLDDKFIEVILKDDGDYQDIYKAMIEAQEQTK